MYVTIVGGSFADAQRVLSCYESSDLKGKVSKHSIVADSYTCYTVIQHC